VIYCSNLCTEIAQNMAPIETVSREVETRDGDTVVVTTTRPGEFVVCNLASLSLGHLPVEDDAVLRDTVRTAVRALDNVIDLNFYPLPMRSDERPLPHDRAGVSGYHHMLAKRGIGGDGEHLAFADDVFERINRAAWRPARTLRRKKEVTPILKAAMADRRILKSGAIPRGMACAGAEGGGAGHAQRGTCWPLRNQLHQHSFPAPPPVWTR
jgi:ribonucleotide reductase alpha subunit